MAKRISNKPSRPGLAGRIGAAIPVGIPPVLKRFWRFTRDMAKRFNKELIEDREDEMVDDVVKFFKKKNKRSPF